MIDLMFDNQRIYVCVAHLLSRDEMLSSLCDWETDPFMLSEVASVGGA